jgi:hypothetical protein
LIVDGPPAHEPGRSGARYPALPWFFEHLASDYTVILDDIRRRGELEIIARWEAEFDIQFERRFAAGIGVAKTRWDLAI